METNMTNATVTPVTTSGWYENADGTVSRYVWRDGRLDLDETVADWSEVRSNAERLAADDLDYQAARRQQ